MKTNDELYNELKAVAVALAHSTDRADDLPDHLADLDAMKDDRARLMTMWVTLHFDYIVPYGDCSNIC